MFLPAVSSTGGGTDAFREPPPQPVNKRTESNVDISIACTRKPSLRSLYIVFILYSHYLQLFNLRTDTKADLSFCFFVPRKGWV